MKLYSFVIPVFNVKTEYLKKCIDSILANNEKSIEVVLIDDNSSNGCEHLCDEYKSQDDRITVYHLERNQGVSNARNIGIEKSSGEWIVFVDSDDWVDADICNKLSQYIEEDTDIIMFSSYREHAKGSVPFGTSEEVIAYEKNGGYGQGREYIVTLKDRFLKQCLKDTHPRFDTVKYCWGKAFSRRFLSANDVAFRDINYCEDVVFMLEAIQKANKVVQIPERMYHYRVSADSVVNSYRKNALLEQKRFLELVSERLEGSNSVDIYYAALLSMQICITRYLFNKENHSNPIKKQINASRHFSSWPYSEVFDQIDYDNMKPAEKKKAFLIKNKLYYLYYLGTEVKKLKAVRYR